LEHNKKGLVFRIRSVILTRDGKWATIAMGDQPSRMITVDVRTEDQNVEMMVRNVHCMCD
jgi:hypothetical protein